MDALSVTLVSAVTSGAISLALTWLSGRQQRREGERARREARAMTYLNPLRWHTAEVHHRLSLHAASVERHGCYPPGRVLTDPREIEGKGTAWFAGEGVVLASSVWMAACLFAQMTRTRHDLPFLRLSGHDDTRLTALLQQVHAAFAACGVYYATQSSIGTDALLESEERLRSYREFCELLAEPDRRVWADPVIWFLIAVAHGERRAGLRRVMDALAELSAFLDASLAGGASLRARHGAEIHRPADGGPGPSTVPVPHLGADPAPSPVPDPTSPLGPHPVPDPVPRPPADPGTRPPRRDAEPASDAGA